MDEEEVGGPSLRAGAYRAPAQGHCEHPWVETR